MMKKPGFLRKKNIYYPLGVLFVVLVLIMPRSAKFNYDYRKGSPWQYETLVSQFDFPILKTQEQLQEERSKAGTSIIPYYRYSDEVVSKSIRSAETIELGSHSFLRPSIIIEIRDIYAKGIISDDGVKSGRNADISNDVVFIQKDKRAAKYPVTEIYKESDARAKLLADLGAKHPSFNMDSICRAAKVYDLITPNLVYDKQTTSLVHEESANYISPTMGYVSAGDLIVSKGEIVTGEIAQMLDSYKVEYEASMGYGGPRILFWLGNALIALALVFIIYAVIFFSNPAIFEQKNKYLYILLIFLLATIGALAVDRTNSSFLYMVPFTLTAIYLQAFFKNKLVIPFCIVSLLPLLIFAQDGVELFTMFLVASMVSLYTFKYFSRGWLQFISAFIVFISLVITYFGFRFIDALNGNVYQALMYLFVGSMLSVAGYPLIYLFEKVFNLVSNSRLLELCDTNNPLLRQLESRASGTFQHSLQVMNMADAVAREVGANIPEVRAGALYHDIGKMENPLCFIENETLVAAGPRFHDNLTSQESARLIIKHVPDGLALAEKYKLPDVIKDFIRTHHGTSRTGYFYSKYVSEGGDPADDAGFCYSGAKPSTKEQIILMVCDSVEAASRTLKDFSPESVSAFVRGMVDSKMKAGQFDQADISLKDINTIVSVLEKWLLQSHHGRIEYPKEP